MSTRRFLARVEESLGVECSLDLGVERQRARRPLPRELAAFHPADAVLAGDRATQARSQSEHFLSRAACARQLDFVPWIDEERGVEIAVTRVPPAARRQ